jgi:nicotinamide-nucleotide amidase
MVDTLIPLVQTLGQVLVERRQMVATAESCTGGWVAQVLTSVAGSSAWFERGFVTYSNSAKREMLGVPATTLARHGAVSEQTARAMAQGALNASHADVALAITGVAGPGGGSPEKPVGTVCLAWAAKKMPVHSITAHFAGDRQAVRAQAVAAAVDGLLAYLRQTSAPV